MSELLDAQALFRDHAFQNALPIPLVIDGTQGQPITLQIRQISQFLGLYDPGGAPLTTTVWGYGSDAHASYPGPTIIAQSRQPLTVTYENILPPAGHLLPIDRTLLWADPGQPGQIPVVTHLHGGHSDSASDGLPEQWFTQNGTHGPDFVSNAMTYSNDQPSTTLWYHDHTLGITRLNVYAGLAGFYLLQDSNPASLQQAGILPSGTQDLGLAIQDRAFTSDGHLYYPAYKNDVLPGTEDTVGDVVGEAFYAARGDAAPSAVPEFFGDTILVNGMAWPTLEVGRSDYNLRLLNGSDSRFYVLKLDDPNVAVTLVGTDGGLLPKAKTIIDGDGRQEAREYIVLAPGDRAELVFDFSKLADGQSVTLQNVGPAYEPFKGLTDDGLLLGDVEGASAGDPVGNIMKFTVDSTIEALDAKVKNGTKLVKNFPELASDRNHDGVADLATHVRKVGLFEGTDEYGRVTPRLGTAEVGNLHSDIHHPDGQFGPLSYDAPVTEVPVLGSTEDWQIFNFTADSHPIHLHLTQYQVVEKRQIAFQDTDENGIPDDTNHDGVITYGRGAANYKKNDIWIGDPIKLRPTELGWQDTDHVDPGTMMSIVAKFDKPGEYVWHCHILSHEDNEMMRPVIVEPGAIV